MTQRAARVRTWCHALQLEKLLRGRLSNLSNWSDGALVLLGVVLSELASAVNRELANRMGFGDVCGPRPQ